MFLYGNSKERTGEFATRPGRSQHQFQPSVPASDKPGKPAMACSGVLGFTGQWLDYSLGKQAGKNRQVNIESSLYFQAPKKRKRKKNSLKPTFKNQFQHQTDIPVYQNTFSFNGLLIGIHVWITHT